MNALMQILAYRRNGGWAFDDAAVGLVAEPFVAGIPEMIDILADQVGAGGGSSSRSRRPSSRDLCSDWTGPGRSSEELVPMGGTRDGRWLCPALFKYFPNAPDQIWIAASLPADLRRVD